MVARGIHITMSLTETTYAQAVERALTVEGVEQHIYRENSVMRVSRIEAHAIAGSLRDRGSNDQKRKVSNSVSSIGDKK